MVNKIDRSAESELLKFAQSLSPKMTGEDVQALWKKIEHEHFVAESKMILLRSIYFKLLNEMDMKEAMESPFRGMPQIEGRPDHPDAHMFG